MLDVTFRDDLSASDLAHAIDRLVHTVRDAHADVRHLFVHPHTAA